MKILFYDTKPYDREAFEKLAGKYSDIEIDYLKTDISYRTAPLSKGYDAVCLFVASDVGRRVVDILAENGVRLILMRCAGYNNVDLPAAQERGISVMRVPGIRPRQ